MVDCEKIALFFKTEVGRKLCAGISCLREFKFSILDDARHYGLDLEGEKILLQGVVDCALIEEDGITIVDFKTDKVSQLSFENSINQYRVQIQTYADALSRIYNLPVKAKFLYYFNTNMLCSL